MNQHNKITESATIEQLKAHSNARFAVCAALDKASPGWIEKPMVGRECAVAAIEEMAAQLSAIGAGGVEALRKRECLHKIAEPWPKGENVYAALPDPVGCIEYPAQPYESAWVSTQEAYDETQMRAFADATAALRAAHSPAQEHATQLAGIEQPTAHFGLASEQIDKLRTSGLKPEEIASDDPGAQLNRVRELVWWFARFADGHANPKWLRGHAFELAYYIACMDVKRGINVDAIKKAAYKEGVMISPAERGMLERIGFVPTTPAQARKDEQA